MHSRFYKLSCTVVGFLISQYMLIAQSASCIGSYPFCTGTLYNFPAGVHTGVALEDADYGCLIRTPNPAWYHMKILEPGSISIQMHSSPLYDIDFVIWGPFDDLYQACVDGLTTDKIVDCSFSALSVETCHLPETEIGEYYILLITNYSNKECDITFEKIAGDGETDCTIIPAPILYVPTVFRPQSSIPENREFKVVGGLTAVTNFQLHVFDRHGRLIFESADPRHGWNGMTINGSIAPEGMYFYKFMYQSRESNFDEVKSMHEQGMVMLLR